MGHQLCVLMELRALLGVWHRLLTLHLPGELGKGCPQGQGLALGVPYVGVLPEEPLGAWAKVGRVPLCSTVTLLLSALRVH